MSVVMAKIAAVLLIGFTLAGCAATGANPGFSASDQCRPERDYPMRPC